WYLIKSARLVVRTMGSPGPGLRPVTGNLFAKSELIILITHTNF
ncbi:16758_t:CDS:2, partial [Cetraspora pellucida]